MATSVYKECTNCDPFYVLLDSLKSNRPYVLQISNNRGGIGGSLDTLILRVNDSAAVDWNLFADTACQYTRQQNLNTKRIYVVNYYNPPLDTLAEKSCF